MSSQGMKPVVEGEASLLSRRSLSATMLAAIAATTAGCVRPQQNASPSLAELTKTLAQNPVVSCCEKIADLRRLSYPPGAKRRAKVAIVQGHTTAGDGGGGIFIWTSLTDLADDDATVAFPPGTTHGSWRRLFDGAVSVRWFGARCDCMTNDSAAVQRAIDYCCRLPRPAMLLVPGRCRVAQLLRINRMLGAVLGEFRIVGEGEGAGFYVDAPITLFESDLTDPEGPKSEEVSFEGIYFEASTATLGAVVLNANKFLRMKFLNCHFEKIICGIATRYIQSYYFIGCKMRRWHSSFLSSSGSYDVNFDSCLAEHGGTLFSSVGKAGTAGLRITNCLLEGFTGEALKIAQARGITISANYFEGNVGADINLWGNGGGNRGVQVSGNFFWQKESNLTRADFYSIIWGPTNGGVSSANFCLGKLHDTQGLGQGSLVSLNDTSENGEQFRGHAKGLGDAKCKHGSGRIVSVEEGTFYTSIGGAFVGLDPERRSLVIGGEPPFGEVTGPERVPTRMTWGPVDPSDDPAFYGNPHWKQGSLVYSTQPRVGGHVGWVCVESGKPGTWRLFGKIERDSVAPHPR